MQPTQVLQDRLRSTPTATRPPAPTTQFSGLSRREIAVLLWRYGRWRDEVAASIQAQVAADPTTPIVSNQRILRYVDETIAELRVELDDRDAFGVAR